MFLELTRERVTLLVNFCFSKMRDYECKSSVVQRSQGERTAAIQVVDKIPTVVREDHTLGRYVRKVFKSDNRLVFTKLLMFDSVSSGMPKPIQRV